MIPTTDITSFTDVRRHLRERLDGLKRTGRPLYVTTNGEPDAVILSPALFDALRAKAELADSLAVLDRSTQDIRHGRVKLLRKGVREVSDELGLNVER
ncbi:MAG TPA: hypothetical protein DEB06_01645 [Phycisphaerales bacterium]|nr:hypothetical protein [Phycisphaerales bacterium]